MRKYFPARRSCVVVALSLAAALLAPVPARPAAGQATITGTVTDTSGVPLAAAQVLLEGPTAAVTTTNARGVYTFASVAAGVYSVSAVKGGYSATTVQDVVALVGSRTITNIALTPISFESLRTIGRTVVTAQRGTFNTSPASVAVVNNQAFVTQGQLQVSRVLDQTPGIVTGHPSTTANGASPGAIVFPNIRGGLSFETASLIDGHPLIVGRFGDYVTTFLNSYLFDDVELIKGPGASAPEINYAIGGTVNFRTKEPTLQRRGSIDLGSDSYGGIFSNFATTGTMPNGRLSYAFDYAVNGTPGPLHDYNGFITLSSGALIDGQAQSGFSTSAPNMPGVQNVPFSNATLVACCFRLSTTFTNKNELAKLRYKLSGATTATFSYLGSQTWTEQNGNHVSQLATNFMPGATYSGPIAPKTLNTLQDVFFPPGEFEINNEPIFQFDVRSARGNDTILARYYAASINRLQYGGTTPPGDYTTNLTLYGTVRTGTPATTRTFNGTPAVVTIRGAFFLQSEEDKLHGVSFEYDHPVANNMYTLAVDANSATTNSYQWTGNNFTNQIPAGSRQRFTTVLLRGYFTLNQKLNATLSNYFNTYNSRFTPDVGQTYQTATKSHYDARIGMTYRPTGNLSLRMAAGSAVAPPYLNLLDQTTTAPLLNRGGTFYTNTLNAGNLAPETSFGYDIGADARLGDGASFLSLDAYRTLLHDQFINATFVSGTINGLPVFTTENLNLANARYEGLEAAFRRRPPYGLGWTLQGALLRAFPYNLPPGFFNTSAGPNTTNLAVVPNINFLTGGPSGTGRFNAVSNQSIPYSQGYAEVNYRDRRGAYYSVGETYYGANNSFNRPAFGVANATIRIPVAADAALQVSVDNLNSIYSSTFIDQFAGNRIPLVNGNVGLTNGNVVGPTVYRLLLHKTFGY